VVLNVLRCGAHNERGSSTTAALPAELKASAIEMATGVQRYLNGLILSWSSIAFS
jgi:hypothetical protein